MGPTAPDASRVIRGMVQPVARREDFYLVLAIGISLLVAVQTVWSNEDQVRTPVRLTMHGT
jgi:hypothetical protein